MPVSSLRHFSFADRLCLVLDDALRAVTGHAHTSDRPFPAAGIPEGQLTEEQRKLAAACMRINHAGEIAAQGLYHGQALVARCPRLREALRESAREEGDHLDWTFQRLVILNSHVSRLVLFWYLGAFATGMLAGLAGDGWSLGFLEETESQVMKHLERHLSLLPAEDRPGQAVLKKMQEDENTHREKAVQAGAFPLPSGIKKLMHACAKVMIKTARIF